MNDNLNNQNPVPVLQTPSEPEPVPQVQADVQNFKSKLLDFKNNFRQKFNSYSKQTRLLMILSAIVFGIIFLLFIIVLIVGPKNPHTPVLTATPTPVAVTPVPTININASRYATDSAVLKIEDNLNNIQKQLDSSDVRQTDLNIPNLDFNINFSK